MKIDCDLLVVGSGFGGSLLALAARRIGLSVALVEKGVHPRFAIGESSSPLANVLLEEIAAEFDLPGVRPFAKWGSWRRERAEIACGLKRGFTFFRHERDTPFVPAADRNNFLLVAASPRDEVADTHWYRAEFDAFLVEEAREAGADYFDRTSLDAFRELGGTVEASGIRAGEAVSFRAKFLVDASGPRGFLARALGLPAAGFPAFPATRGLYTHFEEVDRLDARPELGLSDAPYPADDAAVHHVFDGGWIWVLRFSNGLVSAGCAVVDRIADELDLASGERAWFRLLDRIPTVQEQFARARAVLPWVHAPRLPFRASVTSGNRWALLPSAAAFVDPLLSTGIPLTLLGVQRLARAIGEDWDSPRFAERTASDARLALRESDAAAALVGALYANFGDFPVFSSLSLLYFAAASFSEAAHRLGRPELARSFLLQDDPAFGPDLRRICAEAAGPSGAPRDLPEAVRRAIAPFNVAGLGDPARRNWYPVLAEDLLAAAGKLRATREEAAAMLERTGFAELTVPERA